jgi:hypothetical protein
VNPVHGHGDAEQSVRHFKLLAELRNGVLSEGTAAYRMLSGATMTDEVLREGDVSQERASMSVRCGLFRTWLSHATGNLRALLLRPADIEL